MSFEPTFDEQELLADTFVRQASRPTARERAAWVILGAGLIAAVGALWLLSPPKAFAVAPALLCMLVFVLATLVQIDTPLGFTVPTQLPFVALLFAMPAATVPLGVAVGLAIGRLPGVVRGRLPMSRLPQAPINAWFAVGPAAVLAIAHVQPSAAGPALLLAALAAQFVVDFGASAALVAIARGLTLASLVRSSWVYLIDAALAGIGLVVAKDSSPYAVLALVPLLGLFALFANERHRRLEGMLELSSAYRGTALVLGDVIEADDGYTGEHCKSVVTLALEMAEHLGLSPERQRNLEFAALLHDVGKIAIPKEIINKPGKLDPHEWTIIKTHTLEGQKMLERVGGFMREVGLIVRSHHERWDGGGYPDGLAGEAIPLEARIISCCDSWNAMRTDRPYRQALAYDVAVAELASNAGKQFDPAVVKTFLALTAPNERPQGAPIHAMTASPARTTAGLIASPADG
ncbi:MAG TPA: HD-GYP domain-containing protein [Solirubrobacteraceae bacterium]|nr:HD-GYP domain-containing protein [Solirubrobacteraceae bacterium]